jgi:hypothetical protein
MTQFLNRRIAFSGDAASIFATPNGFLFGLAEF